MPGRKAWIVLGKQCREMVALVAQIAGVSVEAWAVSSNRVGFGPFSPTHCTEACSINDSHTKELVKRLHDARLNFS